MPGEPLDGRQQQRADVEAWLQRLRTERGYSPHTLAAYRHELEALLDGAPQDWSQMSEADLRRRVAEGARAGLSPTSMARRLSAWRGFFDALAEQGRVQANPVLGVRAPKRAKRLPKALPVDLAVQLVEGDTDAETAFVNARDRAMAELLYSSGLRLSELTALDWCWLKTSSDGGHSSAWYDRSAAEVQVLGKGGKRRTVPVGSAAQAALAHWLTVREAWLATHPAADTAPLFLSLQGRRIGNRSVQQRMDRLGRTRGLPQHVHPHMMRHSFASHMLQSSGDLRAVQELLGHASIGTTQIYTSLDFQHLAAVYDAAHPRARRQGAGMHAVPENAASGEEAGRAVRENGPGSMQESREGDREADGGAVNGVP